MGLASQPLAGHAMIISLEKDDHGVIQINTWTKQNLLLEISATWILAHGSTKSTSVFILAEVVIVSHFIGGRCILHSDVIA